MIIRLPTILWDISKTLLFLIVYYIVYILIFKIRLFFIKAVIILQLIPKVIFNNIYSKKFFVKILEEIR